MHFKGLVPEVGLLSAAVRQLGFWLWTVRPAGGFPEQPHACACAWRP